MYLNMATQTLLYTNYENHIEILMKLLHVYSLVKTTIGKKHLRVFWHFFSEMQ